VKEGQKKKKRGKKKKRRGSHSRSFFRPKGRGKVSRTGLLFTEGEKAKEKKELKCKRESIKRQGKLFTQRTNCLSQPEGGGKEKKKEMRGQTFISRGET